MVAGFAAGFRLLRRQLFGGVDFGTDAGMQDLLNALSQPPPEVEARRLRDQERRIEILGKMEDGFAQCDARLDALPKTVAEHEALLKAHKDAKSLVLRTLVARYNHTDVAVVLQKAFNQSLTSDYHIYN